MSLNDIRIPAIVIQELYKETLVEVEPRIRVSDPKPAGISYLGDNRKGIVIIVKAPEAVYLPDDQLNFLLGILTACKLSMADIALLNLSQIAEISYNEITRQLGAEKIILFGVEPAALELPLQFPYYQVQQYNNQTYLASPGLTVIVNDRAEKTKLWASLKQLFALD